MPANLYRIKLCLLFCVWMVVFYPVISIAQSLSTQQSLLRIKVASDSLNRNFAPEKIYLQTDRADYALGDTIWYKAWIINAPSYLLSAKSGLLHVDIATDSNVVVKQFLLPISNGVTWGNITLGDEYKPGTYIIRAFTNWMRNFGDDNFFYKRITISNGTEGSWLVNIQSNATTINGKPLVNTKLLFANMDKTPVMLKSMQVQLMNGQRTISKQKLQTDLNGAISVNFTPPPKTGTLTIVAQSDTKDQQVTIPINTSNSTDTDMQFLPEGGNLIAGLPARVAFKALQTNGRGGDVSGIITDSKGQKVAEFKSVNKGMGVFNLLPKAGELYTAKVTLRGGVTKTYPLPVVKNLGTVLQIDNAYGQDSVSVNVAVTDDIAQQKGTYFLIAKARGVVCYAGIIKFKDNKPVRRLITKNLFPSGVTHFMLTTTDGKPLNERLIYIDRKDNLKVSVTTDKPVYAEKDSVALNLLVTDDTGNPTPANFAIAVTDDALVRADTLNNDNILTSLLLTPDIKGYVEAPGYYLKNTPDAWQALDNLLLTQGWVGYDEPQLKKITLPYATETEYALSGRITNVFNKPVNKANVVLFSNRPLVIKDTLTNADGRFSFKLPLIDTPNFTIQAKNKNGNSFNVKLAVNEFTPPPFYSPASPAPLPWYVNSSDTLLNYVKDNIVQKQRKENLPAGMHVLKQVNIVAKKIVKGSENINGPGLADQVFDEKDLEKENNKTLLQLFQEKITGFGVNFWCNGCARLYFCIGRTPALLVVDGVLINTIYDPFELPDYRLYLQSNLASDVKGIEVLSTFKFNNKYNERFYPPPIVAEYCYIEVTTRAGKGPVMNKTIGVTHYKPLALSLPKHFYKPKYDIKDAGQIASRPTINWEPNIVTDAAGHATVHFNTATEPSTYTIITQGVDFNGNIGYGCFKMKVQ